MTTLELPDTFRLPRHIYDRMVDAGMLEDQHVELIDGEIVQMSPINNPHVSSCTLVTELLRKAFGKRVHIRVQAPLVIGNSEPQPDVAVIEGSVRDYKDHPTTALLVVEISDSTLRFDRVTKSSLYASAGIPEYWVINLPDRQLEIFRDPRPDSAAKFGFSYGSVVLKSRGKIAPLHATKAKSFSVSEIFP